MLTLSRKINERIIINGNIVVTLVEIIGGSKVRLGIEAPAEISIHREEIQRIVDAEEKGETP
jgi:carbon storage regulator